MQFDCNEKFGRWPYGHSWAETSSLELIHQNRWALLFGDTSIIGSVRSIFSVAVSGTFFLANDHGELIMASLSPQGYKEISRAKLIEPTHGVGGRQLVWSHPAFANQRVYARNDWEIICVDLSAKD